MKKMSQCADLKEKIEKDTQVRIDKQGKKFFPRVCIKLGDINLLGSADPDLKQINVNVLESYDNLKWEPFTYFLSAEGESVGNRDDASKYVRKHLADIAKSLEEKEGIVSFKYSDDKYVFHRKEEE